VSKKAPAAGLAASAAAMSSARSPRCGPSGASTHVTSEPIAKPGSRIRDGFRGNAHPLSPGAIVTRTRQPLTVPFT
jgi:hypothetical protein